MRVVCVGVVVVVVQCVNTKLLIDMELIDGVHSSDRYICKICGGDWGEEFGECWVKCNTCDLFVPRDEKYYYFIGDSENEGYYCRWCYYITLESIHEKSLHELKEPEE